MLQFKLLILGDEYVPRREGFEMGIGVLKKPAP